MDGFSRVVAGMWRLAEWKLDAKALLDFLGACIDYGVTSFDHADIYGDYTCEQIFGGALASAPELRDKIQLITKCDIKLASKRRPQHGIHHYDTSRQHIIASVDNSLQTLGTDYIDLLLLHRPDPLMDADEVGRALTDLKDSGKVRSLGVSNFSVGQFDLLASRLESPLVTNQIEFSVMEMSPLEDGILDMCQRRRISPMAWSPFGGGRLFHEDSKQAIRLRKTLQKIGDRLEASIDQVALAWIIKHPAKVYPVLGTGKLERIRKAQEAASMELSREQWFEIWTASKGHEVP